MACLREVGTPLPLTVARLNDVALGRALWRMNADALSVNHDDEIWGYAAPAASGSAAQRVKSLTYLVDQCFGDDALEQALFMTLFKAMWTATCKIAGVDEGADEDRPAGRTGTPRHGGGTKMEKLMTPLERAHLRGPLRSRCARMQDRRTRRVRRFRNASRIELHRFWMFRALRPTYILHKL